MGHLVLSELPAREEKVEGGELLPLYARAHLYSNMMAPGRDTASDCTQTVYTMEAHLIYCDTYSPKALLSLLAALHNNGLFGPILSPTSLHCAIMGKGQPDGLGWVSKRFLLTSK